jgi:hypothetical protein
MQGHIEYSTWFYCQCFLCGLLGICANMLLSLRSLKEKARVANEPFNAWQSIKTDFLSLCLSFVAILIYLAVLTEVLDYKPNIGPWVKALSVTIGGLGAWICELAFGEAKKRILRVIDEKTNIADSITGTASSK